jgi:hypothetical protein
LGDQDTPLEFNTATISSSNDTSGPNQTGRMDDDTYFGGISNNIIVFVSHESFNNIAAASPNISSVIEY